jgi:MFS family permease
MSVVPVASIIAADLNPLSSSFPSNDPDAFASVLPVTIWEVGEDVGPLLIAPLSEIHGWYPLMNAVNLLLLIGVSLGALAPSMPVFVASRALTGMAVTSNVLGPVIIGDIFELEHRGTALSLVAFLPLLGARWGRC